MGGLSVRVDLIASVVVMSACWSLGSLGDVGGVRDPVWMLVTGLGCFPCGPPLLFLVLVLCRARTPCPVFCEGVSSTRHRQESGPA